MQESNSISRRAVLGTAAAASLVRSVRAKDRKPNLLFIMADDHAGYVLGADGNRQAITPNLDRLASEGTRFAANYCNSPVCTPSRQCILTGQLPHAAGVTVLTTPLSEERATLAKALRSQGASTAVMGKMHFNQPGKPGLHGFDQAWTEDVVQQRWTKEVGPAPDFDGTKTKPAWHPFRDPARIWLNAEKLPFPRKYEQMKSTWLAAQASRFLEDHKDDRFALWVSFQEPHSPYDSPSNGRISSGPPPSTCPASDQKMPGKSHLSSATFRRKRSRESSRLTTPR